MIHRAMSTEISDGAMEDAWLSKVELTQSKIRPIKNEFLLEEARRYQPIDRLYVKAEEVAQKVTKKSLEILAVPSGAIPSDGQLLHSRDGDHQVIHILIKSTLNKTNALKTLIIELANLLFIHENNVVFEKASQRKLSKEEFVNAIENIEFKSLEVYNSVVEELQRAWPQKWAECPVGFKNYQRYLEYQKSTGHSDLYGRLWDQYFS